MWPVRREADVRRDDIEPTFIAPRWATSIEGLIVAKARVRATCPTCSANWLKDELWLWRLRRRYGAADTLWNREAQCWTRGCLGQIHFLASCGDGTPFIHLRDRRRKKG